MMQTIPETRKALKEWAAVTRALEEAGQVILFRKGGIIERNHQFEVESPEFFLYPTYLHQTTDLLQPEYRPWVKETEAVRPGFNKVEIRLFARVEKVLEAKGIERLRDLTDAFIWNPEYVEKTWSWEPEKPAYVLFLRAYKLETPYVISERPEYGGCVSWINLQEILPVRDLTPVLDDRAFTDKCRQIESQLTGTMVAAAV